jgi:hypothetical protein
MNEEAVRADQEVYCALRSRSMLVIDGICFSRTRDGSCRNCIFDRDKITVKLLWELLDWREDKVTGDIGSSNSNGGKSKLDFHFIQSIGIGKSEPRPTPKVTFKISSLTRRGFRTRGCFKMRFCS